MSDPTTAAAGAADPPPAGPAAVATGRVVPPTAGARRRDLPRCSDAARERCDPLGATAAWTHRWLLLEHPGPWASDALVGSGVPADVQDRLRTAAAAAGGRVLLVRRPASAPAERHDLAEPGVPADDLRWAVVDQPAGRTRWGRWSSRALGVAPGPEDLAGLGRAERALGEPLPAPADGAAARTPGADGAGADDGPLLLVCTHGRHDTCCAVRGRPVAAALAARWPAATWECSHLGGDRFAPNLLVLPDGAYYGDLDTATAERVVDEHLAGAVRTRHLRGVSNGPPLVQAAVIGVLERCGPAPVRGLRAGRPVPVGPERWDVVVDGDGALRGRWVVTVERTRRPAARLTCRAPGDAVAAVHRAVAVQVQDAAGGAAA